MNGNPVRKEIVDKADIVNIVSQYVKLEKRGNNYIGLCPFHDDKNPSMSVSPQKKVFKCFSCGIAGDVVTFVSKFKNITISEALKEVGETVGIKVALSQKDINRLKNAKYYDVLKESAAFYNFYLNNTVEGKKGIEYLNNRKLFDKEIKQFQIGLAGDNDILYKTLTSKNYLPLDMIEVGVIRGGDFYHDTFKNRIMFPIKDLDGNIVGFSGRRFLPESVNESKYLNTSETILFKKGEILYNFSDCIQDIKLNNNVYLFEGFMDVIAAYRAGVYNSVASMGTALTINQINAIKRITKNITLCYDSDGPGTQATVKAITMLVNSGFNVDVVVIPDGKDPDEYIYNYGESKLHDTLVTGVVSAIDFLYDYEKKNIDFSNFNQLETFKGNIFNHLTLFKSNVISEKIINRLAADLDVNPDSLLNDFTNNKRQIILNNEFSDKVISETIIETKEKSDKKFEYLRSKIIASERKLLVASFYNRKSCFEIESKLENYFCYEVNRNILYKLLSYYKGHEAMNESVFFESLTNDEKEVMSNIKEKETVPDMTEIDLLIKNIKKWPYDKMIHKLSSKEKKTFEDLQRLSEYKRITTIIKKNKE